MIFLYNKVVQILVAIGSFVAIVFGLVFFGYRKGVKKVEAERDADEAKRELEETKVKLEERDKERELNKAAEKVKTEKVKPSKKQTLGKWVLVFGLLFWYGCTPKYEYVYVPPQYPKLNLIERPELKEITLEEGNVLTDVLIADIYNNELMLKDTIKSYENLINAYNILYIK